MRTSRTTLRVRYAETDAMGIVYYANYFVWFEAARGDFMRTFDSSYRELEAEGVLMPVIEAECRYLAPARYDDEVEVRAEARLLSHVRVEFTYEVSIVGGRAIATGRTAHAAVDRDGRPRRLPSHVVEAFQ